MKAKFIFKKITQAAVILWFLCTNAAIIRAAEPEFVINFMPSIGSFGNAEGKIVWDALSAENANQYAVIAVLRAIWDGGGGYYAKPKEDYFLNPIDRNGNFYIHITTGGIDHMVDEIIFYFVERSMNISFEEATSPAAMTGKYLATKTVFRSTWVAPPQSLVSNIRPGFVMAGTEITLSCQEAGVIRYTLDGSNPITSSTAQTYSNNVFFVPADGVLLVKAVSEIAGTNGPVASFVWLPKEPLNTPFWGLNVSLALNGETFGHPLTEETTRERMLPIAPLTKWVRTFGTLNSGLQYINKIAKDELGLQTMIGLYITNEASNNNAQIEGLREILNMGPAPTLISVGNEMSQSEVSPAILASCIDAVREMVLEKNLVIPIGSVDVAHIFWSPSILERLDFIGVNIYHGVWDNTPENQMFDVMKQSYFTSVATFQSKFVLLTEVGVPHYEGTYYFIGGMQTGSKEKSTNFLCNFLEWIRQDDVPAFYFEAYDEPIKSTQPDGHVIEQYFGIMNGNLEIHPFYYNCITGVGTGIFPVNTTGSIQFYPNPTTGIVFFERESSIKVYNIQGVILQELFGDQVDLSDYPQGLYILQVNEESIRVQKK
jgi:exo-beta-1,3-glucanase (GH17 family)